jgi:hypothetical protein
METDWLKMSVDRAQNKGYVIRTDQIWFGHRGIAFFHWLEFFEWRNSAQCARVSSLSIVTFGHTTLTS